MHVSALSVFAGCFLSLGVAAVRTQPPHQPLPTDQPIIELKNDEARVWEHTTGHAGPQAAVRPD